MPSKQLPEGKLPIEVLARILDSIPRSARKNLVVPPGIGIDVGVTRTKGRYLISSSDPITGTKKMMGWHAVNVSANDISTSGIMPDTLTVVALFPIRTKVKKIQTVMDEINSAASDLGITVAGGHTEITPGLKCPIIVVTAFGSGDRFVTAADAKPGDIILASKSSGIEGTSILANLPGVKRIVPRSVSQNGVKLIRRLSVLKEASAAFGTGRIHAMHDVTEGGILGAVLEMSLAAGVGFELNLDIVPVDPSTSEICTALRLDPLRLIGSGSMLIACPPSAQELVIGTVRRVGVECTAIGRFLRGGNVRYLISSGRKKRLRESSVQDELWTALEKYGSL